MSEKAVLSWSGGKDSALALYGIRQRGEYEVVSLLTVLTREYDRVSMHGVRRSLLEAQAGLTGLPLTEIFISKDAPNEEYESRPESALAGFKKQGVSVVTFGDIFLEDIQAYRETKLKGAGLKGLFPNWGRNTAELVKNFLALGFKAIITCVDGRVLSRDFAGRMIDAAFLAELPGGVDPAGENGEYHSFVFEGPIFKKGLGIKAGDTIQRDAFFFCDVLEVKDERSS